MLTINKVTHVTGSVARCKNYFDSSLTNIKLVALTNLMCHSSSIISNATGSPRVCSEGARAGPFCG